MRGLLLPGLVVLAGCENDPDAPVRPLSELPAPSLTITANLRNVRVFIRLDAYSARACPILDESFEASLDTTPMEIAERGASIDSIFSSNPCEWPRIVLDNPPPATSAAIVMTYPRHSISIDLLDLLAPRSAQLVPEGPWTFTPGQTITLKWSPADDLKDRRPDVYFVTDDLPQTGNVNTFLPVRVMGDLITVTLPNVMFPGSLEFSLRTPGATSVPRLGCEGATCQLVETPQLVQHIAWRSAASR